MPEADRYPEGWEKTTFGELAHYVNGYAFRPNDWGKVGLPIIRIEQINDPEAECDYYDGAIASDYQISGGDLLFSWSATLTTMIWDRGPALLNQHIFKVIPLEGVDLHFLHHLIDHSLDNLARQSHGSTMKHIKKSDLLPFSTAVPPLGEQRRIAEILDAADEAIRQSERVIAKLREVKKGLLHDLLTRGLDDEGNLRDPEAHPEQFKDSVLGKIPREWTVGKIEQCCDILDHKRVPINSRERRERQGDIPYYGANGQVGWIDDYIFDEELVLIAEDGGFFDEYDTRPIAYMIDGKSWVNNHAHVLRAIEGVSTNHWLFYNLVHRDVRQYIRGGTRSKLNQGELREIEIPLPSITEQERIGSVLDGHYDLIDAEETTLEKLRQVKRGLMDDLLTGRVRVGM